MYCIIERDEALFFGKNPLARNSGLIPRIQTIFAGDVMFFVFFKYLQRNCLDFLPNRLLAARRFYPNSLVSFNVIRRILLTEVTYAQG